MDSNDNPFAMDPMDEDSDGMSDLGYNDPAGAGDDDDLDDLMLQQAIAMSMAQATDNAAPAAAPAAPPGAPVGVPSAAEFAQLLASITGAAPPPPPVQPPAAPAAAPAPAPAPRPAQTPRTAPRLVPSWVADRAAAWAGEGGAATDAPVPVPDGARGAVRTVLEGVVGGKVTEQLLETGVIQPGMVDVAVAQLGGSLRSGDVLSRLAQLFGPPHAAALREQHPTAKAALLLLSRRVAARAMSLLESDSEEDLWFEGGQQLTKLMDLLASGAATPEFVDAAASAARPGEGAALWEKHLRAQLAAAGGAPLLDAASVEAALRRLDRLLQAPTLLRALACLLAREAAAVGGSAVREPGRYLSAGVLGPLLSASPIPDGAAVLRSGQPGGEMASAFTSLRGYPSGSTGQVAQTQRMIQQQLARMFAAAQEIAKRIARQPGFPREALLAWLAAALDANRTRAEAETLTGPHGQALLAGSPDAFCVGGAALALHLCAPFMGARVDAAKAEKFLGPGMSRLDAKYYAASAHRLPWVAKEPALAARTDGGGGGGASPPRTVYFSPSPEPAPDAPHFVAECFFLAQAALHLLLMPTAYKSDGVLQHLAEREEGERGRARGDSLPVALYNDLAMTALLDPGLATLAVDFVVLQARWLLQLATTDPDAFRLIPAYAVKDMAAWLTFLLRHRQAGLLGGMPTAGLMGLITRLLASRQLVASPLVQSKLVQLILMMLSPQLDARRGAGGHALGSGMATTEEKALVAAVLGCREAQTELVPALMRCYADADHVEGLDIDRDQYDKFNLRSMIDSVLMELWKDEGCAGSLQRVVSDAAAAGGAGSLFSDYVGAVLNDLIYLLKDSLGRFSDAAAVEASMADEAAWKALRPSERADKEAFHRGQCRTGRAYLRMAQQTLRLLAHLAAQPELAGCLLRPPLAGRAAYAVSHFMEALVGSTAARGVPDDGASSSGDAVGGCFGLKLRDPERLGFDPARILEGVATFTARLAVEPAFAAALGAEPDFEPGVLRRAVSLMDARTIGGVDVRLILAKLAAQVDDARGGAGAGAAAAPAAADPSSWVLPQPEPAGVEDAYRSEMAPLAIDAFDSSAPRAYNSRFRTMAGETSGSGGDAGKARRLTKEMRALRGGRTALPMFAGGAILLRHDAERMDMLRALITGPEDTPYAYGCFFFDVYCPPRYPDVPPLMELATTGGGRVRFNPNLYADGKVCLSLLGTWHGADVSQKWDPDSSSLYQLLMSIQALILVPDPYFNEPNVEAMRGKAEGATASQTYNAHIVLNTVRWAMTDVLNNPPPGFEQATRTHFRLLRHRILAQLQRALAEFGAYMDEAFMERLRRAGAELHALLVAL